MSAGLADNGLLIQVSDTGKGIPEENIDTVMDPFVQVRESSNVAHEGTGLGLYLARTYTEIHGGKLEIQSKEGQGTTVSLRFPASLFDTNTNDITTVIE